MKDFGDFIETIFPDEDYRSVCMIIIILAFIITLGITACSIVDNTMTNLKCMAQPEVCIQKTVRCPATDKH
jgi:hypothetical protein